MSSVGVRSEPAPTGSVWEGSDGWIVLITKSGQPEDASTIHVVHQIQMLAYPSHYAGDPIHTLSENLLRGGMAGVGFKRIV